MNQKKTGAAELVMLVRETPWAGGRDVTKENVKIQHNNNRADLSKHLNPRRNNGAGSASSVRELS